MAHGYSQVTIILLSTEDAIPSMSYSLLITLLKSMSCIAISWNRQSYKIINTNKTDSGVNGSAASIKSCNHHYHQVPSVLTYLLHGAESFLRS